MPGGFVNSFDCNVSTVFYLSVRRKRKIVTVQRFSDKWTFSKVPYTQSQKSSVYTFPYVDEIKVFLIILKLLYRINMNEPYEKTVLSKNIKTTY